MSSYDKYDSEDMFADTRMSFGEHLEELRTHLWKAIYGFLIAMFFSLFIGKTVLKIIAHPVTEQLEAFYNEKGKRMIVDLADDRSLQRANQPCYVQMSFPRIMFMDAVSGKAARDRLTPLPEGETPTFAALTERTHLAVLAARQGLQDARWGEVLSAADELERLAPLFRKAPETPAAHKSDLDVIEGQLKGQAVALRAAVRSEDPERVRLVLSQLDNAVPYHTETDKALIPMWVRIDEPLRFFTTLNVPMGRAIGKFDLATLSVQEAFMAYFKVCMACGLVFGSPWIFYQIWLFVAAGLYPHEKRLVNVYLPVSVVLFLAGVAICQFFVIPKAIEALLWFNQWIGLEPDLRFNEWLSFAIMMPLVFGVSFQMPLVMMFLERLGIFTVEAYVSQWKIAFFVIHVFAAVISPSVDIVSMELLAVPLFGLYWFGILMCRFNRRPDDLGHDDDVPDDGAMVGV